MLSHIFLQLVFDRVNKRLPGCLDDVLRYADGAPYIDLVARFDNNADAGGVPSLALTTRTL